MNSHRVYQVCGIYYYIWIVLLPKWGGYEVVEEFVELDDGARTTRLVRKYYNDVSRDENREEERRPLLRPRSE